MPDLRDQFPRGANSGSGTDPEAAGRTALRTGGNTSDNVGSKQGNGFKSYNHSGSAPGGVLVQEKAVSLTAVANPGAISLSISNAGENETRIKNVNVKLNIDFLGE